MYWRKALALLFALMLSCSAFAVEDTTRYVLQLKWFHQYQFAGYYAALEKGFYKAEGLDVEIRERDVKTSPVDDVLSGRAHFGVSDSSLVLRRLNGQPVVALAVIFQHSPLILMTLRESGLQTPEDLVGKRVMYQRDVDDAVIIAMFNEVGIKEKDFLFRSHTFDNFALINGEVDAMSAYISNQPYLYQQQGRDVNIINPANYGIDFYGDNLFTSEALMKSEPEKVLAFRRASLKGWQYALENSEEVIGWILEKYSKRDTTTLPALRFEAVATERLIKPRLVDIGNINPSRFSRIANIYRERASAPVDADISGLLYSDYLEKDFSWRLWLQLTMGLAAIALVMVGALLYLNRRLTQVVENRTRQLSDAKEAVEKYVDIINKYTITATVDAQMRFTAVSDAFCQVCGYQREELLGQRHTLLLHPSFSQQERNNIEAMLIAGNSWHGELTCLAKSGDKYFVSTTVEPMFDDIGNFAGCTHVGTDITDKKRIEVLAATDHLTGLLNRSKVKDIMAAEMHRADRSLASFSVILLDIDYFKAVNDRYGHQVGDELLVSISRLLKQRSREIDSVGRWGGEEFIIVCPETDFQGAIQLAESLRANLAGTSFNTVGNMTASFGVAEYQIGEPALKLIERADKALYQAKEVGRNRVCSALVEEAGVN